MSSLSPEVKTRRSSSDGGCFGTCFGSCSRCLLTLTILAVVAAAAVYLGVRFTDAESPSDLLTNNTYWPGGNDWIPDPRDFDEEDPFNATNPQEANKWQSYTDGKGGLTLEIVNALEPRWYPFFEQAVQEWDAGTTVSTGGGANTDTNNDNNMKIDFLQLTVTMSDTSGQPDPDCNPIDFKMKVCNGNYGETGWKGLNTVSLLDGEIVSSAAKMNEYYLANGSDGKKQYTMCHEIGHGFGLPHTDENFDNADTGECMDYTDDPENNTSPGPRNFEFLRAMYGTLNDGNGGDSRRSLSWLGHGQDPMQPSNHRNIRMRPFHEDNHKQKISRAREISHRLQNEVNLALQEFEQQQLNPHDNYNHLELQLQRKTRGNEYSLVVEQSWQEEFRNDHVSVHSRDFGYGYTVQVARLLVAPTVDES